MLVLLTGHLFESVNVFHDYKKKRMTLLCKDKVLSHGKTNFYWSSKIQMLQPWSKLSVNITRSEYFAESHEKQ